MTSSAASTVPPSPAPKRQGRSRLHPQFSRIYPLDQIQNWEATLVSLDQFQFLTSAQVARLFFLGQPTIRGKPRSLAAAQKAANEMCLRRLKDRGLVEVLYVGRSGSGVHKLRQQEVNMLTDAGADLLKATFPEYAVRWRKEWRDYSNQTFDHELEIIDAMVALTAAAQQAGYQVADWHNDLTLRALAGAGQVLLRDVKPDGYFSLRKENQIWPFFLEIDRGTESIESEAVNSWRAKMRRYADYFRNRYRQDVRFIGTRDPLVLTVTTSWERLEHLWRETTRLGNRTTYWFTCQDWLAVGQDALGENWRAASVTKPVSLRRHLGPR